MRLPAPRHIGRTGDDSPARSLAGYVWRMSGWHQLGVALLAIGVSVLGLAPIELQRRLIDDAIGKGDGGLLVKLALVYLGVVVVQQALKLALRLAQGWLGESAVRYTRAHLLGIVVARGGGREGAGERVAVLTTETDQLGGFVGEGPSAAAANLATLAGVLAYTFWVEPRIALIGVALLVPQVIAAPLMQRKVNRLTARRLSLLRGLGRHVSELDGAEAAEIGALYRNRLLIHLWKGAMKAVLNLANHFAPLGILLWGGFMVIEGETTLGVLVAFATGFERMAGPARELIGFYRKAQQAGVQHCMIAEWMEGHHGGSAAR
ncbi:ABC transporter ATP-binding protein [Limibaculum sp. FT325]|uniref:ABC transporter transmembrane domain-containing protein n=1 Tax=Thermohalobaculum sediminis TaxID=2939436 RepID=UPI0020BF64D2|nr:ABC transporter ATP-binding protein [Limibaculum sediminis]MCL5778754.1 ABC transporter ATP-binding protein [Limibaculum sediminis]